MALSGDSLDALVKPGLQREWEDVKNAWFPRTDTPEHEAYDRRTPGKYSTILELADRNMY